MLATPLALLGLLALPALAAIYWLRRRSGEQPVSSLFLWVDERRIPPGGAVFERLQTPLSFLLELAALALLAVAAAGPMLAGPESRRPLYVVLDDSYSMLAGHPDNPRARALREIREELERGQHDPIHFIAAGRTPRVLGRAGERGERRGAAAATELERWRCLSPGADLDSALSLAAELGRGRARILVVTDHAPSSSLPEPGRIEHRAFGGARDNLAFVAAARTARDGRERCILEVQNFSPLPVRRTLVLEGERRGELARVELQLAPGERRVLFPEVREETGAVTARWEVDALEIDDRVTLLSDALQPVPVANLVRNGELRSLLERALAVSGVAAPAGARPGLVLRDHPAPEIPGAWSLEIAAAGEARSHAGPFMVRRSHPLSEGLSLEGVVWGAPGSAPVGGTPIVAAGDVVLLSELEGTSEARRLRMAFRPELSTLQQSPDWPVLVWNLLAWRATSAAGARPRNVPLGGTTAVTFDAEAAEVRVVASGEAPRTEPTSGRTMRVAADVPGMYRVESLGPRGTVATHTFASNALDANESDLRQSRAGRWGRWGDPSTREFEYRSMSWLLLLAALAILTLHWKLYGGRSGA